MPNILLPGGQPLSAEEVRAAVEKLEGNEGPLPIARQGAFHMEQFSGRPLLAGNRATLLPSRERAFETILREIRRARDHINLETFIFKDDAMGRLLAENLLRKQRKGVQVHLIYDSYGSLNTPPSFIDELRAAGVQVVPFNPLLPFQGAGWHPFRRNHSSAPAWRSSSPTTWRIPSPSAMIPKPKPPSSGAWEDGFFCSSGGGCRFVRERACPVE